MNYFSANEKISGKDFVHLYTGVTIEDLTSLIEKEMLSSGYKKLDSTAEKITFSRGNRVLRILFGAFVKYFKFSFRFSMDQELDGVKVHVVKDTSGMSGGIVGVSQVKKELKRIAQQLQYL